MGTKIRPDKIARWLLWTGLALLVLNVAVLVAHYSFGFHSPLVHAFSFGKERNFPTFFAGTLFFFCAGLALVLSLSPTGMDRTYRRHWLALSAVFVYCDYDELFEVHEKLIPPLRNLLHLKGFLYFGWVVPFAVLLLILAASYLRFLRDLPSGTRTGLIAAGGIYVLGAMGMEMLGARYFYLHGGDNLVYTLHQTVEESLELGGLILCVYVLMVHLRDHYRTVTLSLE